MNDTLATAQPDNVAGQQDGADAGTPPPESQQGQGALDQQAEGAQANSTAQSEAPQGAPEEYGDFSLPEGMKLDEAFLGEFKALAKGLNLSQENAQKVVDLGPKLTEHFVAKQQAALEEQSAQWVESARADKEFGGDKFDENLATANKVFEAFGTPELRQLLVESKLGNHPELIRWAHRVGKALSEDTIVRGSAPQTKPVDPAKKLYPYMN